MNTKKIALIGLMTAVICVLGPISFPLPVSPVPISLGLLGVLLATYMLGMKWGTVSCLVYLLLGLVGLPVFTGLVKWIYRGSGQTVRTHRRISHRIHIPDPDCRLFYRQMALQMASSSGRHGIGGGGVLSVRHTVAGLPVETHFRGGAVDRRNPVYSCRHDQNCHYSGTGRSGSQAA